MFDRRKFLSLSTAALCATALTPLRAAGRPQPPHPPKHPQSFTRFGHTRHDDYAWLRPENWAAVRQDPSRLAPEIYRTLRAENAYAEKMLAPSAALQKGLMTTMQQYAAAAATPPATSETDGAWLYGEHVPAGQDRLVFFRRNTAGKEQILLDTNKAAAGHDFYALSFFQPPQHSRDQRYFAWAEDVVGAEYYHLYVRDMVRGRIIVSDISDCFGCFVFSPDSRHLFWMQRDAHSRPTKIFRRDLIHGGDTLMYHEPDPGMFMNLTLSPSGEMICIEIFNADMKEVRLIFADAPQADPLLVEPRQKGLIYDIADWQGGFVIRTNADGAEDFKIMRAQRSNLSRSGWQAWISHEPGRYIAEMHPKKTFLVRMEWQNANQQITINDATGHERQIRFNEPAYTLRLQRGQSYDSDILNFSFESPRQPTRWYGFDMKHGKRHPIGHIPQTGFDSARYEVRQLQATAPDGEKVPVTVLMRKGMKLNGRAPLLLYGYGSYGDPVLAQYSAAALALVDKGWVYALAHVRGGCEKGTYWWRSVMGQGKKKTFTDFIVCAEHLIRHGYSAKGRIVPHSFSAGGLMMGAVYNMRPDLWAGVIMQVPFLDLLGTMSDMDHPLWYTALPFWGDPRNKAAWAYMASYAPYDNLAKRPYPPLLATGSLSDDRVGFWEPLKFVIKARQLSHPRTPKLARINMASGHIGASDLGGKLKQLAMFYGFAIQAVENHWPD